MSSARTTLKCLTSRSPPQNHATPAPANRRSDQVRRFVFTGEVLAVSPVDGPSLTSAHDEFAAPTPVRPIMRAYEQVAAQLRELIATGHFAPGERLANEAILAREFGVSRPTIREALRLLAAQGLIRTAPGRGGGSYVTIPSIDHVSEFLRANLNLLSDVGDGISIDEYFEARLLLEVPGGTAGGGPPRRDRLRTFASGDPLPPSDVSIHNHMANTRVPLDPARVLRNGVSGTLSRRAGDVLQEAS